METKSYISNLLNKDAGELRSSLVNRANFGRRPIDNYSKLAEEIIQKRVMPYQLEVHPGRTISNKICWMNCPYCYGVAASNSTKRLSLERYIELIWQTANGPHGKIQRLIYTGHATDPLYCEYIEALIEQTLKNAQIFGIYTKMLGLSDQLIELLISTQVLGTSYINISIDAGLKESYNKVHGLASNADVLSRVLRNIKRLTSARDRNSPLDVCTTYLITKDNNSNYEIESAINNISETGVDTLRFSFVQEPRGANNSASIIPHQDDEKRIFERISKIVQAASSNDCIISIMPREEGRSLKEARIVPCVSRFTTPTIGFDGYLYHCSESAAPDFHDIALADLGKVDFWDAYYNYNESAIGDDLTKSFKKMELSGCRCNRECYTGNQRFNADVQALKILNLL